MSCSCPKNHFNLDRIIAVKNFLSKEDLITADNIIKSEKWTIGYPAFKIIEGPMTSSLIIELSNYEFFTVYLKEKIEQQFNKKYRLKRVHVNGQSYGQNGHFHKDIPGNYPTFKSTHKEKSFCLYLTSPSTCDYGGYLLIQVPGEDFVAAFLPTYNSGVLFPSDYVHRGLGYNKHVTEMRLSVCWTLEEID